jgi:7-cyano-7-deazaguanine synthase
MIEFCHRIHAVMGGTAVLLSGGLDSVVLLADELAHASVSEVVQPVYVSFGLAWEDAERLAIARALDASPFAGQLPPLVRLSVDMRDVYAVTHWAVRGTPPSYHTPDEDVYLPGRNVILLGKAGVFCAAAKLERIVLGTLEHNPFPDATPDFRASMARTLSLGLAHPLTIEAPFASASKADVIRKGVALGVGFERSLSCMSPVPGAKHCGTCSKCRERHDAFLEAGIEDPTEYADLRFVGA